MKKVITLAALALVSVGAQAATYTVTGGTWSNQQSWNTNATGSSNGLLYDNGEVGAAALLGGTPGIVNWSPALPASYDGTYSGTIITDGSNNVIGGSLIVSGTSGYQVVVGAPGAQNSWWAHSFTDVTMDFATNNATALGYQCHDTPVSVAACAAGGSTTADAQFGGAAGEEGIGGTARAAATFDGTSLVIFNEGYSAPGPGTDYMNTFTLTAAVVPVPAAVWLFGSAIGLLGFRRKMKA